MARTMQTARKGKAPKAPVAGDDEGRGKWEPQPAEQKSSADTSETKFAKKMKERTTKFGAAGGGSHDVYGLAVSDDSDDEGRPRVPGLRIGVGTLESALMDAGVVPSGGGAWGPPSVTADFRAARAADEGSSSSSAYAMPEGVELVGGEVAFEEQDDGSQALVVPEGGHLRLSVRCMPYAQREPNPQSPGAARSLLNRRC